MSTTYSDYRAIASNLDRSIQRIAADPGVARRTADYLARIGGVKSIDALLKDDKLYRYVMQAHGLDDMIYAKGLIRGIASEDPHMSGSLVNKLADSRFKAFAESFDFARYGPFTTIRDAATKDVAKLFARQKLESDASGGNEGVRLALYFQRKAGGLDSAYSILADRALYAVAQTALDLPSGLQGADIDRKAAAIDRKLKIADLKSPEKLEKFLQRFAALHDLRRGDGGAFSAASEANRGMTIDLMMSIQRLR